MPYQFPIVSTTVAMLANRGRAMASIRNWGAMWQCDIDCALRASQRLRCCFALLDRCVSLTGSRLGNVIEEGIRADVLERLGRGVGADGVVS